MDDLAKVIFKQYVKRFGVFPSAVDMATIHRMSVVAANCKRLGRWVIYKGHRAYRV